MNNQILICNFERQNEINKRILERNIFFDNNNNNVLELRSQCTKYTFPILNNNNNDNCFNIEKIVTNFFIPNLTTNVPFVNVATPTEKAKAPNI